MASTCLCGPAACDGEIKLRFIRSTGGHQGTQGGTQGDTRGDTRGDTGGHQLTTDKPGARFCRTLTSSTAPVHFV